MQLQTVKALLTEVALRDSTDALPVLRESGLRDGLPGRRRRSVWYRCLCVPVWQKQPSGGRLLCYCFGETESDIRSEVLEHGRTESLSGSASTSLRNVAPVIFGTPGVRAAWVM